MRLLIDTHVLIWWNQGAATLSPTARAAIADPANQVCVSAASVWEIAIKAAKGKLAIAHPASESLRRHNFACLPIDAPDAEAAAALDWPHPDPFDRMLVAQARRHGLTLVHADRVIGAFPNVAQLWAA